MAQVPLGPGCAQKVVECQPVPLRRLQPGGVLSGPLRVGSRGSVGVGGPVVLEINDAGDILITSLVKNSFVELGDGRREGGG